MPETNLRRPDPARIAPDPDDTDRAIAAQDMLARQTVQDDRLAPARGILKAILFGLAFWIVAALVLYWLILR